MKTVELHCSRLGKIEGCAVVLKIPWKRKCQPHSSILAWDIQWTEETDGLQSMRSQKRWTQLSNWACTHAIVLLLAMQDGHLIALWEVSTPSLGRSLFSSRRSLLSYSCAQYSVQVKISLIGSWGGNLQLSCCFIQQHHFAYRGSFEFTPLTLSGYGYPRNSVIKNPYAMQERIHMQRRPRANPWIRKIPWRREGNPLQYACLGNPMETAGWQATVYGIAKSQTWLSD